MISALVSNVYWPLVCHLWGCDDAPVALTLSGGEGMRVDPVTEIVVTTDLGTEEVRWEGGAWEAWTPGMLVDDLTGVDTLTDAAGTYLLEARADSDDETIVGLNVQVPTFIESTPGTQILDAGGRYWVTG